MNQYAECNGGEVDQLTVVIETWNLWEELMTPKVSDKWSTLCYGKNQERFNLESTGYIQLRRPEVTERPVRKVC